MKFEWDRAKADANERKHVVSFEEAASIFRDFHVDRHDLRRDYGETRFIALGVDSNGLVLNVVYTLRGEKASKHGRKTYAKARTDRSL